MKPILFSIYLVIIGIGFLSYSFSFAPTKSDDAQVMGVRTKSVEKKYEKSILPKIITLTPTVTPNPKAGN